MTAESNLPIPRHPMRKYPWNDLGLGDSFFVSNTTVERMSSLAARRAKATSRKYTCRTLTENGCVGVRVWRIL